MEQGTGTLSQKARLRSRRAPPPSLFVGARPLSITSWKMPILVDPRP
jgi:hypothetical protein